MEKLEYIVPCHFGLEAVLKREIQDLGYEIVSVEDGRIVFAGDKEALCRANIFLRSAERVLIKISGDQVTSLGSIQTQRRKVLGSQGSQCEKQAFQSF